MKPEHIELAATISDAPTGGQTNTNMKRSFLGLIGRRRSRIIDDDTPRLLLGGSSASAARLPRLLPRDRPFHQSSGKFDSLSRDDRRFLWHEAVRPRSWFHLLLTIPTTKFLLILTLIYTVFIVLFAFIFLALNNDTYCALDRPGQDFTFLSAFSLSVISSATLGLGGADAELGRCLALALWLHVQVIPSAAFCCLLLPYVAFCCRLLPSATF